MGSCNREEERLHKTKNKHRNGRNNSETLKARCSKEKESTRGQRLLLLVQRVIRRRLWLRLGGSGTSSGLSGSRLQHAELQRAHREADIQR
jgi:hypothetical protein